jgi:hypothetical protein
VIGPIPSYVAGAVPRHDSHEDGRHRGWARVSHCPRILTGQHQPYD